MGYCLVLTNALRHLCSDSIRVTPGSPILPALNFFSHS